MPRIVACGGRRSAFDDYCTALRNGERAMLLVDSECAVTVASPWRHLSERPGDAWPRPEGAQEHDCHLMVQCMESWFLADRTVLAKFFGQGFNENALPSPDRPIEQVEKNELLDSLARATKTCKTKSSYGKGEHSFQILALIDPARVSGASFWAKRFLESMDQTRSD
jgi:hypothetical protein